MSKHLNRIHEINKEITVNEQPTLLSNKNTVVVAPGIMAPGEKEKIDLFLAKFIACSNAPYAVVENNEFKLFCYSLNSNYSIPCRTTVSNLVSGIYSSLIEKAKRIIENTEYFSLSCDFWSYNGIGIYGLLFTYYDEKVSGKNSILLYLQHVEYPHTGQKVLDITNQILTSFGIRGLTDKRLVSISCDNGSNMKRAFDVLLYESSQDKDSTDDQISDSDSDNDSEIDFGPMEEVLSSGKRIGCINHALSNNLKNSIIKSGVDTFFKKVIQLLVNIKNKGLCIDILKQNNHSIILPPKTRWSYYYDCFQNLIKIRDTISLCCNKIQIDNIPNSEYELLKELVKFLKKYKDVITSLESPMSPLSKVVPALTSIKIFLSKRSHLPLVESLRGELQNDFETRFEHIFGFDSPKFCNFYLIATAIDVKERKFLNCKQLKDQKLFIQNYLKSKTIKHADLTSDITVDQSSNNEEYPEFAEMELEEKRSNSEYESFSSTVTTLSNTEFWEVNKKAFPQLYLIHCKVRCMSPTSCEIESAFSIAAQSSGVKNRRNRLSMINLEKENFIRFNKKMLYMN